MKLKPFVALATSIFLTAGLVVAVATPVSAAIAETYNFNTAGDLANNFDATVSSGSYSQSLTGGIADSGAIWAPSSLNAVFASKNSYSLGAVGTKYTFSSLMKSVGNSGYSGMGFSATPSTASSVPYRPNDALGISVHGGGFVFHNGSGVNYSSNWGSASSGSITAVKSSTIPDLLNAGSSDQWYKVFFMVEVLANSKFTMRVEVWPANGTTGETRSGTAEAIFEVREVSNSAITNATTIKSYINFSGYRVTYFDNFVVDLTGNASVVAAGAPVVLTNSSSLSGSRITFNGNLTSENGSTVTERGFVYSTNPNPTTSNTKVVVSGSGTGTFTSTTGNLSPGTYYARAFATNSTGTSYGAEQQTAIVVAPTISWAPTNTSAYVLDSTVTPSEPATSNSSGAITYSIQSQGTTGCSVNSGTGVISFTSAGTCAVRATVAAASPYSSGFLDRTFTILANTVSGAPTTVTATAGDALASVSWSAPSSNGGSAITAYTVTASPGGATCTASAPLTTCTVSGLTNGTLYTFSVTATNSTGASLSSTSSTAVTPAAPLATPAPSNPTPETPVSLPIQPAPAPSTKVSSLQVVPGKTPGSSIVKLQLSNSRPGLRNSDVQIKLYDTNGKLIKSLIVPLTDETGSLQIDLALPVGEFTVKASVISAAGVASEDVAMAAPVVRRSYFTPSVGNTPPVLDGAKVANPIGFAGSSSALSEAARTELRKIAIKLKSANGRIALTGFSAMLPGQSSSGKALATKRASAVAKFLKKQGVRLPIFFAGYGALNNSQADGSPRKVEIRLIK